MTGAAGTRECSSPSGSFPARHHLGHGDVCEKALSRCVAQDFGRDAIGKVTLHDFDQFISDLICLRFFFGRQANSLVHEERLCHGATRCPLGDPRKAAA
jgi:hypothetical protein